ncbi:MAG: Ppx/GppA family phosphatase [Gammaproteobacteria bacterium]|jgi:exopolyphosphatase/guanosine-5'-triphosphate,3'-diphosphate pyrophosphatase|nr:Ppx/GppA family phosphatase [Gammaproteobacteria bacterium]MBP6053298.1 Ppx/GppA family phosphatase [Pseudomonadales bacterium]MBK7168614.1 Ppx/GppA family phosphatase [Gammaproteobacteria bacterium]MBK7520320.1 Ppx/GppA family phosphatase [Gammaproteobacteria bacterium]MBK7728191.1 Ppx/GppA family phosphatase [Gammaproteobacteria bacterium]
MSQNAESVCAVLDLGSNSFHLLIGRLDAGRIVTVDRRKDTVRLAQGLGADELLDEAVMARALDSLGVFAEQLRKVPRDKVRVVGTNTLRAARNADVFLERAERVIGVPIDVISGQEEGRLIFLGVVKGHASNSVRRLVIDIGGGSTEFIVGKRTAKRVESLFIGCVSLSERFFPERKISSARYRRALTLARAEIRHLADGYGVGRWDEVVGSSGTVRYVESAIDKLMPCDHLVTREGIECVAEHMLGLKKTDALQGLGLSADRIPVFPGGLAILHAAFLELGIERMHVSDYALKEGVLYELADQGEHEDTRRRTIDYLSKQFDIDRRQAARVERVAKSLLPQVADRLGVELRFAQQVLGAAAQLHELGLTISHGGYHRHGAYVLENADMPGFSRREQKMLSFLVLNHRRKPRTPEVNTYRFKPDWALVLVLRLACLFNRIRVDQRLPALRLRTARKGWKLEIPADWLRKHPLVEEDLRAESEFLAAIGTTLKIATVRNAGGGG